MGYYIDLNISLNTFNDIIEALTVYCEQSSNYHDISWMVGIIENLEEQKERSLNKQAQAVAEEFGLDKD